MRLEEEPPTIRTTKIVYRPQNDSKGGYTVVNPAFANQLAALGLDSAAGYLELPGEVVSGHPDRHVLRVALPGFPSAFYLKRQHRVSRKEKLRNWAGGFGWASRCEREAAILGQLSDLGLPCPRWAAYGVDAEGRSFLMIEELATTSDLRVFLRDLTPSLAERISFAVRLGTTIEGFHSAGFTTPDLSAKHVLISTGDEGIALIDWQSARRVLHVSLQERLRSLAMLHASVGEKLASPRERLRVFRAALRNSRKTGLIPGRFSVLVRRTLLEANRIAERRSLRDQRQPGVAVDQRLVWLAGEAVCAVPNIAAAWPKPAVSAPYYDGEPGTFSIRLPDGRDATLIRGRSGTTFERLAAFFRGRSWRSPGVALGRVLFHLERYGIPAPRLFAFGQRFTSDFAVDWFALHAPSAPQIDEPPNSETAERLGRLLRSLHEAGCSVVGNPLAAFGLDGGRACVRDIRAIRIAKPDSAREMRALLDALSPWVHTAAKEGYRPGTPALEEYRDLGMKSPNRQNSLPVNR